MELSTERRDAEHADLDQRPTVDVVHAVVRGHQRGARRRRRRRATRSPRSPTRPPERMDAGGRVIYVGAGSGGRLALVDAAEWGPTFSEDAVIALVAGARPAARIVEEAAAEDDAEAGAAAVRSAARRRPSDVVIGVTASGHTPYVLGALAAAHEAGRAHRRDHLRGRRGAAHPVPDRGAGRRRGDRRLDAAEGRHGPEARAERVLDRGDGPPRPHGRQPDGEPARRQRQAARARGADLRRRDRRAPRPTPARRSRRRTTTLGSRS